MEKIPYDKTKCEVCGKLFSQLGTHLKSHNISTAEYKLKFPNKPLQSQKIRDEKSKRVSGEKNPRYGKAGTMLGKKQTEEAKRKIREARAKQVFDEKWRENHKRNTPRGENHWTKNEELKKKYLYGEANHFYGRKHTAESKKKMSENNSSKRPENRLKLSSAMKRRLSGGWTPKPRYTRTKPHKMVMEILDELGINYVEEKPVRVFRFDFYLPDYKVYIEVNGDYIHGNPTKYTDEQLNEMQRTRIKNDIRKEKIIKNRPLLYLWSGDIKNEKDLCVFLILKLINGEIHRANSYEWRVVKDGREKEEKFKS